MKQAEFPDEFLALLKKVTGKRARIVVNHILEHGAITTEDLEQGYGYKHPPRAVADVRDQGIPIETFSTTSATGKSIAGYRFGNPKDAIMGHTGGRQNFPKSLKSKLYKEQSGHCAICQQLYNERYLQIDHRIPYLIAGEVEDISDSSQFMLLCRSCNRAKSWSCEQCTNVANQKDQTICRTCYWVSPDNYQHITTKQERRIDLIWSNDEVTDYDQLVNNADQSVREYIKHLLKQHLDKNDPE